MVMRVFRREHLLRQNLVAAAAVLLMSCRSKSMLDEVEEEHAKKEQAHVKSTENLVVSAAPAANAAAPDGAAARCETVGQLSKWRYGLSATTLSRGRVVFVGGRRSDAGASLRDVDILSEDGRHLSAGPPLLHPRAGHTAVALFDKKTGPSLLVVGGGIAALERLDLARNKFVAAGAMKRPLTQVLATSSLGDAVLVGGDLGHKGALSPAVTRWRAKNALQPLKELSAGRSGGWPLRLDDANFVIWGGLDAELNVPADIEYRAATAEFVPYVGTLPALSAMHVPSLPKDELLAVDAGVVVTERDVYTFSAGSWNKVVSANLAHTGGAAAVISLSPLKVVFAGGTSPAAAAVEVCMR